MKARFVLASLLVSMMVVEVSAQQPEYDDMYFRGKDREKNKAIDAEEAYASAKTKKQKPDEVSLEEGNVNPTDSYSARNVNPEYVSRSNSEKASEDESNYYMEGYTPPTSTSSNFNNSYYNNANWASNSYYANSSFNRPYYGSCGYCDPFMSPAYGYGPSYGWGTGLSISMTYGNSWSPYGGYGMYNPYYGYGNSYYGNYGNPAYYGSNNYYYEAPSVVNYGKRPSRHSAVVQPTQRPRTRDTGTDNIANVSNSSNRIRQRQAQDEYYVRPARRSTSSMFDNSAQRNSNGVGNSLFTPSTTQPTRTRESYSPSTRTPSYTPSSSPSPSRGSSGGSGGGGGSSPRPRGRD